jgi:hypothetical protein
MMSARSWLSAEAFKVCTAADLSRDTAKDLAESRAEDFASLAAAVDGIESPRRQN